MGERMIQIGQAALRTPTGDFMPAIPIYIKEEHAGEINPHTGRTVAEDVALGDVAKIFAEKHRQYVEGCKAAKRKRAKEKKLKATEGA